MSRPRAATSVAMSRSALPARKRLHDAVALLAAHAAVQRLGAVAVRVSVSTSVVDLEPRAAEDERRRRVLHVEHAAERGALVRARDDVGDLADARQLAGGRLLARDRDRATGFSGAVRRSPRCAAAASPRRAPSGASGGVASRMASRSSAKPMSSISSASSSTSMRSVVELQRLARDVVERAARASRRRCRRRASSARSCCVHRARRRRPARRVTPMPLP